MLYGASGADLKSNMLSAPQVLQQLKAFGADKFNLVKFSDSFTDRKHIYIEFEKLEQDLCNFFCE